MLKFLRSFALTAVLLLPFATQAQTYLSEEFGSQTTGWSGGNTQASLVFSGTSLNTTTAPSWSYASYSNSGLPGGHYYYNIYNTNQYLWMVTPSIDLTAVTSAQLTFDLALTGYNSAAAPSTVGADKKFMVIVSTDNGATWLEANATTWLASGGDYVFSSIPYTYQNYTVMLNQYCGNTVKIAFYCESTSGSGGDMNIHLDNVIVERPPTCLKPINLAASDITSTGATITWVDALNTGATYTVINLADSSVVASGLPTTSYTATGLSANTAYNYSVYADCGGGDHSAYADIAFRTACAAISLPYFTSFEQEELPTGNEVLPFCWNRYHNSNVNANCPYSYNYTYGASTGSRSLYIPFSTSNGDTMMAILPEVDTAAFPMSGNQLRFMAYAGTSTRTLMVGTVTDPTDPSTFVMDAEVELYGSYAEYEALLGVNSNGAYPAIMVDAQSGAYGSLYLDDIYIEQQPTCFKVNGLAATTTSSTITLSWADSLNTNPTYSIRRTTGTDTAWFTTTDTAYTFTALPANTTYGFLVRALCSASDSSREATLTGVRTLRDEHGFTTFTASGTLKRGDLVFDTLGHAITIPVNYATSYASGLSLNWSIPTSAAVFVDTTGDGSYTCQVYTSTLGSYLQANVPLTVRVKAEDRALYTDYTLLLQGEDCVADRNLVFSAERIRYTASWDNPDTLVTTHYFIHSATRLQGDDLASAQYITVTGAHQYTVEDLARETKYYVYLKTPCDTAWIEDSVTTRGLGECNDVVIADGTGTNSNVPLYGNYAERPQRIQTIYPASMLTEIEGLTIDSLHYFVQNGSSTNWGSSTWEVSLGVTTQENLTSGYVDTTLLTRVYTGTLSASTANGMSIKFNQPFSYTGGNLVVQFVQRTGSNYTSCSFYGISTYSTAYNASRYSYPSSASNLWTDNGSTQNFMPKFSFSYCQAPNPCPEVTAITIDTVSNTIANISWTAADADYCVGNQIIVSPTMLDETALESASFVALEATAVSYNATGLTPDHDYYVYIKTLCNGAAHDEGTSGWATATFHTFPTVRTPEIVSATVTGKHTAQLVVENTGAFMGQTDNFSYLVSTSLLDATALASATPTASAIDTVAFTVDNLASLTTYYFYVRNEQGSEVSPWSEPDSVTMPAQMPAVADLATLAIRHNAITAAWVSDIDNFADETAWRTAIALHGQEPAAADWITVTDTVSAAYIGMHLFTGLLTDTAYDIYVCAFDEATGMTSDTVSLDSVRTATYPTGCEFHGTGTSTQQYFFPGYYGWQYMANLYDISQTGVIDSIAAELTSGNNGTGATLEVWVKEVPADFAFTSTMTFQEMTEGATKILEAANTPSMTTADQGWINFPIEGGLAVQGGNQLLVLSRGVGCSTGGGCSRNERYTMGVTGKSWNKRQDTSDPGLTTTGSVSSSRTNMRICYTPATCLAVSTLYALDVTDSSANMIWAPGDQESAWEYAFSTSDTLSASELETAATAISTSNVTLGGLVRDTLYTFYLRPVCSDTDKGYWSKTYFRTAHIDFFYDVTVSVNDEAMGSAASLAQVLEGTDTVLVAVANEHYHLDSWTLGSEVLGTTDTLAITVDSNMAITANFAIDTYTLTATAEPAEGGSISGVPTEAVDHGASVSLTAEAVDGYVFVNWTDAAGNELGTEETLAVVVTSDTAVVANFTVAPHTVVVNVNPADAGSVSGVPTEAVAHGSELTLTATANTGFAFVCWTDGSNNVVSTDAAYTFTVLDDITLTANFEAVAVYVTVSAEVDGMGTVLGAGEYEVGSIVTLTAQAHEGYRFVRWSNGETTATITFTATDDVTLTAYFEQGTVGIDEFDIESVVISAVDSKVIVRGAEGQQVMLFDVNGRCMSQRASAAETEVFTVSHAGVYLVKVGNAPAKRVVVAR